MCESELPKSVYCSPVEIGYATVAVHKLDDGRIVVSDDDIVGAMFGQLDDYGQLPDMIRSVFTEHVDFWHRDNILAGYEPQVMSRIMLQVFSDARIYGAEDAATKTGHVLWAIVSAALSQLFVDGFMASIREP